MLKVGLEEISESACRWPIGDPTSEEFVYCGIQTAKGRSYCAGHCRMAYKPPNSRVWDGAALRGPRVDAPPKAATRGLISARRMGARARASGKRFARARSFCLAALRSLAAQAVSLEECRPGVFGEFHHVERVLHQSPARNRHGRRSDRHGDSRSLRAKEHPQLDDVQAVLTTAQSSLVSSPAVHGSLDGARIIGEIKDLFSAASAATGMSAADKRPGPPRRDAPIRRRTASAARWAGFQLIRPAARAGLSGAASASRGTRAA